jgi:hypothetical protein
MIDILYYVCGMIKENELRIGNLLNHNNGSMVGSFIVGLIHLEDIIKENSHAREYEPIPLTEEWLINFGFKKSLDSKQEDYEWGKASSFVGRRAIGLYKLGDFDDWNVTFREDVGCGWVDLNEIEYVHELQNLFYMLVGEELILDHNEVR